MVIANRIVSNTESLSVIWGWHGCGPRLAGWQAGGNIHATDGAQRGYKNFHLKLDKSLKRDFRNKGTETSKTS